MRKKSKTKAAKPAGPSLAKLRKEVMENYKNTPVERKLYTFTKEHYNETLSSPQGFGAQDLKELYLNLYLELLKRYKSKLVCKLVDAQSRTVELWVKE